MDFDGVDDRVRLHAEALLRFCLPRFEAEGKSYLTVAFGCTGGRHRSVVLTEHLARILKEAQTLDIEVVHRDVHRTLDEGQKPETLSERNALT